MNRNNSLNIPTQFPVAFRRLAFAFSDFLYLLENWASLAGRLPIRVILALFGLQQAYHVSLVQDAIRVGGLFTAGV